MKNPDVGEVPLKDPAEIRSVKSFTIDHHSRHRITYHEVSPEDPRIVITFAPISGGMNEKGFGTEFCIRNGWNTIFVGKRMVCPLKSGPP